MRELTKAEHYNIKALRENGHTLNEIAHKVGLTKKQVRNYCKKNNL